MYFALEQHCNLKETAKKKSFSFTLVPQYPRTSNLSLSLQHWNQSAWQNESSGGPNWCTNPVADLCGSVESAESKHCTRVINGLPLEQESGAGLTERLWTIDQGEEEHAAERQTFGLKQHCSLIWWHWREALRDTSGHVHFWWFCLVWFGF